MSHAKLAPSAAHRWINCPGSVAMSEDIPNTSSTYADEGTKAHTYAAWLLEGAKPPVPPADDEMVSFVSVYTAAIRRAAEGKLLLVEAPIDISDWTGEPGAKGTADVVIVDEATDTIEVHDLKYGMGHIVYAENNEQLMLYALGVLCLVEGFLDKNFMSFKLVIHQPRRDHLSEWTVSREELLKFGTRVGVAAHTALTCEPSTNLNPSAKACLWCPAKATCPALRETVEEAVMNDFAAIDEGSRYPRPNTLYLVDTWLSAVKQAIFEKLARFEPVPGWKLVKGREGNRRWNDEATVEQLVKEMRIPKGDSHDMSLKSPAQLEKLGLSPKRWAQIAEHITRNEAKPILAEWNDPRPAIEQAKPEEFDIFAQEAH